MLNQDKLARRVPHGIAPISRIDLGSTIDSIFIIKSLLAAIIKDCASIPAETEVAISKLKQEIDSLETKEFISVAEFFAIDNQFYLALSQVKKFQRLTKIIIEEKLHVDRIIRLAVNQQECCKPIIGLYRNILDGIQSNSLEKALTALGELASVMEGYSLRVEKYYPDIFPR